MPSPEGSFRSLPEDAVWEVTRFLDTGSLLSLMGASAALDALVRQRPLSERALELGGAGAAEAVGALLARVRREGARLPFITALRLVRAAGACAPPLGLALECVSALPALRRVSLRGAALTATALRAIEALPAVEHLDLSHCSAAWGPADPGACGRAAPAWAPTIRALHVRHFPEAERWLQSAAALPRLAELSWGPWVSAAGVRALVRCEALVALALDSVPLSAVVAGAALAAPEAPWGGVLARLRALSLLRCDLHPPAHLLRAPPPLLEALRAAPRLEALRIASPVSRPWAGGDFRCDSALLRALAPAWPPGLRALELSPAPHFCDAAAALLAAASPGLEALALGAEDRGASALGDAGAAALCALPLRALALPWCARLIAPPLHALAPRLQRASFSGCTALDGGALAALLGGGGPLEELRLAGAHRAAVANAASLAALAARGCVVGYSPRAEPADADAAPRYLFGENVVGGGGGGRCRLLRGWFFEGGEAPPPAPPARAPRAGSLAARRAASGGGAPPLLLPPPPPPPHFPTRDAARAAHAAAAEAAEAAALCAARCACPLQYLGCNFVAAAGRGSASARGAAITHLRSGSCAYAVFVCPACGADLPQGAPAARCDASDCAAVALRRAVMPHIEGGRLDALRRGEEPRPPRGV